MRSSRKPKSCAVNDDFFMEIEQCTDELPCDTLAASPVYEYHPTEFQRSQSIFGDETSDRSSSKQTSPELKDDRPSAAAISPNKIGSLKLIEEYSSQDQIDLNETYQVRCESKEVEFSKLKTEELIEWYSDQAKKVDELLRDMISTR